MIITLEKVCRVPCTNAIDWILGCKLYKSPNQISKKIILKPGTVRRRILGKLLRRWKVSRLYRVRINYRRILQNHIFTNTRPDSVWFLPVGFRQGQCLRPTTSKDTTRIARAHQHRNRERHTRHAWEGLAGMGVSPGHLPCHTWGAHRMHLRSLWNCKHSSFKW